LAASIYDIVSHNIPFRQNFQWIYNIFQGFGGGAAVP